MLRCHAKEKRDDDANNWRDRIDQQPAERDRTHSAVLQNKVDGIDAVGKIVRQDGERDYDAERSGNLEGESDADTVEKTMERKRTCASDSTRRRSDIFFVLMMQNSTIEHKIEKKAERSDRHDCAYIV